MTDPIPKMGIAMDGCARSILEAIETIIDPEKEFVYVELGLAEARTLSAVGNFLKQRTEKFQLIGVDIEEGWSLNIDEVRKNIEPIKDRVTISLAGSQDTLSIMTDHSVSFLLIDACHAKDCCVRDFVDAIPKIAPGGFVAFHDTADFAQNIQPQPHCNQLCNVREALKEVGLLDGLRPGWHLWEEIHGEPTGDNNGMIIFKKE